MVYRLFGSVGSLLALCVLQAMMAPTLLAQQAAPRPNQYLRYYSPDGQPARNTPRAARNLGEVFTGGAKHPSVQQIANEEQLPPEESVLNQDAPSHYGEPVRRSESVKSGAVGNNSSVFESSGEFYEGGACDGCCDDYAACCSSSNCGSYYARAEYLYWWLSGDRYPPLVTTSPDDTSRADAGVLGEDGTRVLFGDDSFNTGGRSGVRTVFGVYLTDCTRLEGDWFTLGGNGVQFNRSSEGDPILARPFYNIASGNQDANLIAFPDELDGRIDARVNTDFMGAGMNLARSISYCGDCRGYHKLDFLYGFRYLGLYDQFDVNTSSTVEGGESAPIGTRINIHDAFSTSNSFFGGNIGVSGEANRGRWFFTGAARIGIGGTRQRVSVNGSTFVRQPGEDGVTSPGGLLALPTNMGKYSNNSFGLVPHLELRVAYCVTSNIRWSVGYDLMYWSRVVRPGEQVDLFVNPTQNSGQPLQGTPGPLFPFKETDLWVTGVSTGFEFTF